MPYILGLKANLWFKLKLGTFDYHENTSQRTVDKVLLIPRFILHLNCPLSIFIVSKFQQTHSLCQFSI